MEPAEKQLLQFPGCIKPGGWHKTMESKRDARLLEAIARRDTQGLAELYRHRAGLIYSLLLRMLCSETEAQEAMQDTFVHIWRRAPQYDARRASPLSWMLLIARGLAIDRLRTRSRRDATRAAYHQEMSSLAVEQIHAGHKAERDELATACAAALQDLPESQSRPIQLAFFRGWTHEEIAEAEGEPLGTIKARIRRGLLALRDTLKEFHG